MTKAFDKIKAGLDEAVEHAGRKDDIRAFPSVMSSTCQSCGAMTLHEYSSMQAGMTLRDYFITHAPPRPTDWVPDMGSPPDFKGIAGTEEFDRRCELRRLWVREKKIQASIQWPAFWADAMLAEREGELKDA